MREIRGLFNLFFKSFIYKKHLLLGKKKISDNRYCLYVLQNYFSYPQLLFQFIQNMPFNRAVDKIDSSFGCGRIHPFIMLEYSTNYAIKTRSLAINL